MVLAAQSIKRQGIQLNRLRGLTATKNIGRNDASFAQAFCRLSGYFTRANSQLCWVCHKTLNPFQTTRQRATGSIISHPAKSICAVPGRMLQFPPRSLYSAHRSLPALARDIHTVAHHVDAIGSMGVGIDGDLDAFLARPVEIAPVQVEARRVGVDLNTDPMLGRSVDYGVEVDRIAFSAQEQAPGGMTDDIDVGMGDGAQYASGLLLLGEIELAVDRGYNEIQRG